MYFFIARRGYDVSNDSGSGQYIPDCSENLPLLADSQFNSF